MSLYQLIYVSSAKNDIAEEDINNIIKSAINFNSKNDITGLLLYRSGIFMQLLEGSQTLIDPLFEKIKQDNRHNNIIQLIAQSAKERMYPNWAMGLKKLGDLDFKMVNEILSWNKLISAAHEIDKKLILHLLTRFKEAKLTL